MINVGLFLQIWSLFLGIVAALIGVYGYLKGATPPHVLILGKTFPVKPDADGDDAAQPLLEEEGFENANVRSWSTRNAAIGWACVLAGGFLQTKDAYVIAFTMCVYREVFDVIEKFSFEPKDIKAGVSFGIMGIIDIIALAMALKM